MDNDNNLIRLDTWEARDRRDELLERRRRIRRSLTLDWGEENGRRYPYQLACNLPAGHKAIFRRSGWKKLDRYGDREDAVLIRETFAWVEYNGERVAAVALTEINGFSIPPNDFWRQMDCESDYLCFLADVLLSAWPNMPWDVYCYGPSLEVDLVWVHPLHPHRGIWKPVVGALIERVLGKCSIIFARCFPIEYGGLCSPGAPSRIGFERRRDALMRVFEREFGMGPLPGPLGEREGYVWASRPEIARHIPAPGFSDLAPWRIG